MTLSVRTVRANRASSSRYARCSDVHAKSMVLMGRVHVRAAAPRRRSAPCRLVCACNVTGARSSRGGGVRNTRATRCVNEDGARAIAVAARAQDKVETLELRLPGGYQAI